ncbi:MAG: PD-(D/E)XK nuclease family protein [Elainellaceae cyanobacterium]
MRLSQGHLNLLALCLRKFQYVYLDQIGGMAAETPQQAWGSQFHQLMLQQDLGLSVLPAEPDLARCFSALQSSAPQLFDPALDRQSEYRLSVPLENHSLVVVYDRLVLAGNRATIYDWKTYARPPTADQLAQSWQTRLYLYVLAEAGPYPPEALSMIYWFVRLTPDHPAPRSVSLSYSAAQHRQTHVDLTDCLRQIDQGLAQYPQRPFPKLPPTAAACETCPFAVCCDRLPSQRQTQRLLSVEDAAEVSI